MMAMGEIRKHQRGGGKRRDGRQPKGRQLEDAALDEVRALLGDRPRRRDLLIEHLHLINDRYGHLSAAHLAALAHEMRLAQTEVYEVATFYAHFHVVKEGETPPPPLTIRVCDSLTCELMGARAAARRSRPGSIRPGAGGAGALHGALRRRAGRRGRSSQRRSGECRDGAGLAAAGDTHPASRSTPASTPTSPRVAIG